MTTSKQIIEAARDEDLRERLAALAAARTIPNPTAWVAARLQELVSVDLDAGGPSKDSIATIYEYAQTQYERALRPGENPAWITDEQLQAAIQRLWARETAVQ